MNGSDKTVSSNITLGELPDSVTAAPEAPLVFLYEGTNCKYAGIVVFHANTACA